MKNLKHEKSGKPISIQVLCRALACEFY